MSIPQVPNKPAHQVVRVSYDKQSIKKFTAFGIVFAIVMIFAMLYTISVIEDQSEEIRQLTKMVNELTYRVEEQAIRGRGSMSENDDDVRQENGRGLQYEIEYNFQLQRQELKRIRMQSTEISQKITVLSLELKDVTELLEEQMKSSWQLREIIESLKKKFQSFVKIFQGINLQEITDKLSFLSFLKPDLGSMKASITGKFNDLKDKVGGLFEKGEAENGEETTNMQEAKEKENKKEEKIENDGFFAGGMNGIKNKIRRKWSEFRKEKKETEL